MCFRSAQLGSWGACARSWPGSGLHLHGYAASVQKHQALGINLAYLLPPRLPSLAAFFAILLLGVERLFLSRKPIRTNTRQSCERLNRTCCCWRSHCRNSAKVVSGVARIRTNANDRMEGMRVLKCVFSAAKAARQGFQGTPASHDSTSRFSLRDNTAGAKLARTVGRREDARP